CSARIRHGSPRSTVGRMGAGCLPCPHPWPSLAALGTGPLPSGEGERRAQMSNRRLFLAVAACALVPYLPALWNGFAMDDLYIIVWNPVVHSFQGVWGAFGGPYWPPDLGGQMYRPLPLASFALDWGLTRGHPLLFHAVNLVWHAGVSLTVAMLARRWADWTTALLAGLIFA